MKAAVILIFALALSGCQTTQADFAARFAVPPDYRAKIVSVVKSAVKDPYSIRSAEVAAPSEEFVGLLNGGNRPAVCFRFNGKNSFGAYTGVETFVAVFDAGSAVFYRNEFACRRAGGYEPFPELEQIK